jgi:hypothetical protein
VRKYLLDGNIRTACRFLGVLLTALPTINTLLALTLAPEPIAVVGDEVLLTHDNVVNGAQLAVHLCWRAHDGCERAARGVDALLRCVPGAWRWAAHSFVVFVILFSSACRGILYYINYTSIFYIQI